MGKKNNIPCRGSITYEDRCRNLGQNGLVLWLTGLSGSGKSTLAIEIERQLLHMGKASYRLDADHLRQGLNSGLGFTNEDRMENIRRLAETASLMRDAGLIAIVCAISPSAEMRDLARKIVGDEYFIEVYVKADAETCEKRDPKGLYSKARKGEIDNFTGISSAYEPPGAPELVVDTDVLNVNDSVDGVLERIRYLV